MIKNTFKMIRILKSNTRNFGFPKLVKEIPEGNKVEPRTKTKTNYYADPSQIQNEVATLIV